MWPTRRSNGGNKYGSKRAEFNGKMYHSQMERNDAIFLHNLLKEKKILELKEQHKIDIRINGKHWRNHYVDFLVTLLDGRQKYVETKGFFTEPWKMKKDAIDIVEDIPYLVNPSEAEILA